MIPTVIALGFAAGLTRFRLVAITLLGVLWAVVLELAGDPLMGFAEVWLGGKILGALNAGVGVALAIAPRALLRRRTEPGLSVDERAGV